jgi:protein-S-isoprenylcysteine O-methyltransferase Ste14
MEMDFDWEKFDVIGGILTASTTIPFLLFATAGVWHFGGNGKSGTGVVSIASLLGFIAIMYSIWTRDNNNPWPILGIVLQSASVFLFGWCIGTSGKRSLSLAFGENSSKKLLTEGPYSVVRHPFYTSYIIFWIGGVAVAYSVFTIASALMMIVIYFYASRGEDKVLAKVFANEFPKWHKNTGTFFPKWH